MNAAALLARHGQALSLVRKTVAQAIDPDTGAPVQTVTETEMWSGTGSLQPAVGRDREGFTATAGGVRQVLVSYRAYLPAEANPEQGWTLRDADGRDFAQVTEPLDPGGAGAYWLLNLGPPNG